MSDAAAAGAGGAAPRPRSPRASRIALLVERNPGIRFREIMRATGLANGVVSHHLGRLETDGAVRAVRRPRRSGYYPPGLRGAEEAAIQALRRETPRRIVLRLMEAGEDGLEFSRIAELAGRAPSTVSASLSQLVRDGVVRISRTGRARSYAVADREMVDGLVEKYGPGPLDGAAGGLQEIISAL